MSAPRSKLSAIFGGSFAGLLAVVILLMVPVIGVRKQLDLVVLDWQELVLYSSCLIAGTIAGARVAIREFYETTTLALSDQSTPSIERAEETTSGDGANQDVAAEEVASSETASLDGHSEPVIDRRLEPGIAINVEPSNDTDTEPPSTVPQIEESLAGGPKKPRRKFWTEASKARTRVLLLFLYLLLFVMCAVLCQKISLGSIVTDLLTAEMIRNAGLGLSVTGLYLMIRGMFVKVSASKNPALIEHVPDLKIGAWSPQGSPHVPPSRLNFLKEHPVCAGWLVLLTGLPLVFLAWFPLIAIPGLFIGMNWLFVDRNPRDMDFSAISSG